MLRDRHLAEDAWQKTVVRAIESAGSVRLGTIRGWLFRIALNEARAILRERSRLPSSTELTEGVALGQRSGMDYRELPMDQQLIREELRVALRASLELLPVDQREVIRRRVYLEMSFAEIAADMKVPLGTVLTWMRRGVVKLREDRALQKLLQD
jgi:RNA polymerase sigma-70 factor (ECF subfamily)